MSDNNLDIKIKLAAEGTGGKDAKAQIQDLTKATSDLAMAEAKRKADAHRSISAKGAAIDEEKRHAKTLEELKKNQVEQTEEEKKAILSKGNLKNAIKGLKHEFPELAMVAKLAMNPIMGVVAVSAGAVAAVTSFISKVDEMMRHAQEFATFGDRVNPAKSIEASMKPAAVAMQRGMEDVYASIENITTRLAGANAELQTAEQRVASIEGAALATEKQRVLEAVAFGVITREKGAARIKEIEIAAQQRRDQRAIAQKEKEFGLLQNAAFQSRNELVGAQGELEPLNQRIVRQKVKASQSAKDQAKLDAGANEEIANIDSDLAVLREFASGNANMNILRLNMGDPAMIARAVAGTLSGKTGTYGGVNKQDVAQKKVEELEEKRKLIIEGQVKSALVVEQDNSKLAILEAERASLVTQINEALRNKLTAEKGMQAKHDDIVATKDTIKTVDASRNQEVESKQRTEAATQAHEEVKRREGEAAETFRQTHIAPAGFDIDPTGKATMQAVEAMKIQNDLLAEMTGYVLQGNTNLRMTNSRLKNDGSLVR